MLPIIREHMSLALNGGRSGQSRLLWTTTVISNLNIPRILHFKGRRRIASGSQWIARRFGAICRIGFQARGIPPPTLVPINNDLLAGGKIRSADILSSISRNAKQGRYDLCDEKQAKGSRPATGQNARQSNGGAVVDRSLLLPYPFPCRILIAPMPATSAPLSDSTALPAKRSAAMKISIFIWYECCSFVEWIDGLLGIE